MTPGFYSVALANRLKAQIAGIKPTPTPFQAGANSLVNPPPRAPGVVDMAKKTIDAWRDATVAPDVIGNHSGDAPAPTQGGATGISSFAASGGGTASDVSATASGTDAQTENRNYLIQILFVGALIWIGFDYIESR